MQIAFDHQIFGWQEYGGISRYIYELARELSGQYGQDVNIISPLYVNRYLQRDQPRLQVRGIPIRRIPKTGRLIRAVNFLVATPVLWKLAPDIIHETYYASRRSGPRTAKHILTVHDMIHEKFPDSFSRHDPTHREKVAAVKRADHVICVSQQTQRDLIEITGVSPDKTSVVYHGFTLTLPPRHNGESSSSPENRPYLLYVGNRGGYKNFDRLLQAVATSAVLRRECSIICFGGGTFSAQEIESCRALGLTEDRVLQVSGPDSVLAQLYTHARAFVYPSLYEGFGIPPLEAMSFGCPVACSQISSIPEVVANAGEYFQPTDVDDMRHTLERIVSDSDLREELIRKGYERIQEFSWSRCAGETLEVYRHTLNTA